MSRYQLIIDDLRSNIFLSNSGDNVDNLLDLSSKAITNLVKNQGDGPLFPTFNNRKISEIVKSESIPKNYNFNHNENLDELNKYMQRSIKANSPYMVKNIIPQPSFIYLSAYVATSLYMGNAVSGEDAGEALKYELACVASIAKLAKMDANKSSGLFTFGGTATNLYALKIALSKANPDHLKNGLSSNNYVVIGSKASHYSHETAISWLGIGQDNYIKVKTNSDQTTNLKDLELKCKKLINNGKKIICIEAVGGTTSNMAIDDIDKIKMIRDSLIKDYKLDYSPHIHVDSVLGWVWLNFIGYDFNLNPLKLSKNVLRFAQEKSEKISKLYLADSFGVDFHKTGYMPYNSSMIILKDKSDFNLLKRNKDIMTPLFNDSNEYNPGIYTLETSRSSANIISTWITLNSFGQEGYQVLLSHALAMRELFTKEQNKLNKVGLVIENSNSATVDIFIRCIKTGTNVQAEHKKELKDDKILKINSEYTNEFYDWFTNKYQKFNPEIAFSKTSASFYNDNESPIPALRFYLLSINISEETIKYIVSKLIEAKMKFDKIKK